ncbi:hypothetical protein GCM10009127_12770 [Alteraurantiacibacter aestuarii]|uniref:Transporter n=1 Tax=Alteraurantiacibacter aestuarii TaxID=650004 RepID=A0A844ZKP2_9SPHN|nr:TolC family protein [Alteraurantiacibacter aestuarii]MXO88134.1 transporter [Alteraurantiacibacter aestuarii]
MKRLVFLLPALVIAAPLHAEPGLPDEASVLSALDDHPSVIAANERVTAARAGADARAIGPHELTFSGSYTQRRIDREGSFDEFDTQLSRAIRLPGKARLDREIGTHQVDAAQNMAEDVRHQAALMLAGYWWDWLGAAAQSTVDARAVTNLETARNGVRRRMELGDASLLELDQAEAALGAARILADQSAGEARLARVRLAAQFPALALPVDAPEIPQPEIAPDMLMDLHDLVLSNSHEIAAADAQARSVSAYAERTRLDRIADPTIGVRLFSERSGAERGAGVVFSIPLGGGHRAALADQAQAEASAALSEARLARFDVQETADADLTEAQFRIDAWQRARAGLDSQVSALVRLRRGHELGEIDLAELLLGERMVHDAFRAEGAARAAAGRAITKLRIDSHALWLSD